MLWKNITGLLGMVLLCLAFMPGNLRAEEVGINYQILGSQPGNGTTTTAFILEFVNLAGDELSNLTVSLENPFSTLSDPGATRIGTLGTTDSRMIMASFTVSDDTPLPNEGVIRFHLEYDTADGIQRAAVLQGQPTVFIGNPIP